MVKNLPANAEDAGDIGLIPGLGRSPGEGNGNPLQYSCLENSMDRGAWQAVAHGLSKGQTRLSMYAYMHTALGNSLKVKVKLTQSCQILRLHGLESPWNFPSQTIGVDSLSLLQGIFPIQESNQGLLHCRQILYQLSYQGSPENSLNLSKSEFWQVKTCLMSTWL